MNKSKLLTIGIGLALLVAVVSGVLLISNRVNQTTPVAPTAPQSQPSAASCTLEFDIVAPTPTPTPTPSPTPSPTPVPACGSTCSTDADCPSTMICSTGLCRNPSCVAEEDCLCASPTPTPTPTPSPTPSPTPVPACGSACVTNEDCPSSMTCSGGACRNPSCTGEADCICPTPGPSCNSVCAHNGDCPSDMVCVDGINRCRKQECTEIDTCSCPRPPAGTTTPTQAPIVQATPAPVEELPKAGFTLPTFGLVGVGVGTIIIGILGLLIL